MVVSLESVNLGATLVREAGDAVVVLASELIDLLLMSDIGVFELMKPVLLLARVVLLEALDLAAEALVVGNQLLLVRAVLASIMLNANAGLSDVDLELAPLVLGVTDEFLVHDDVSLQIIADL